MSRDMMAGAQQDLLLQIVREAQRLLDSGKVVTGPTSSGYMDWWERLARLRRLMKRGGVK